MMRMGPRWRYTLGALALILSALGAVIVSRTQGAPRVAPGAAAAPELVDPTAGSALPEDARARIAPESTLAGAGHTSGRPDISGEAPQPESTLQASSKLPEGMLPTRVVFLDSASGREVPGVRWTELSERLLAEYEAAANSGAARSAPRTTPSPAPPPPPLEHRSGDVVHLAAPWEGIVVTPLEGWVFLGVKAIPSRRMPRAREGRMTVLLHPEVDVRVEILGPDGQVAEGARVTDAFLAGATVRPVREERAPDGTRRLRGIPFFAGETLHLAAHWTGPPTERPGALELPPEPSESEEDPAALPGWHGRMPERPESTLRAVIRLAGPTGLRDHLEVDTDSICMEALEDTPPPDPSLLGTVRVQLLDREGKPASGVRVSCRGVEGTTDVVGRAALEGVHQGTFPCFVRDDGWTFPTMPVTVVGRRVTEVVARELEGGDVEILVRDTDGNPVPFATLEVGRADGRIWHDVDDAGIQRLDPYVDVRGRRLLTHLPPGTLRVRAYLGTQQGHGEVAVVDRGRRVLPITVAR